MPKTRHGRLDCRCDFDGELNEESMVRDFGHVKKNLKRLIDEYVDHKLYLEYSGSEVIHDDSEQVEARLPALMGVHHTLPAEAYAFVYSDEINMESVGVYLKEVLAHIFQKTLKTYAAFT